jgi:hypothetical protein
MIEHPGEYTNSAGPTILIALAYTGFWSDGERAIRIGASVEPVTAFLRIVLPLMLTYFIRA